MVRLAMALRLMEHLAMVHLSITLQHMKLQHTVLLHMARPHMELRLIRTQLPVRPTVFQPQKVGYKFYGKT